MADELRQSSNDLTRMARLYSVTGDENYRQYFEQILAIRNGKAPRPEKYHHIYWDFVLATGRSPRPEGPPVALKTLMKEAGFTGLEFALLQESELASNHLVHLENEAMNAMVGLYQDQSGKYTRRGPPRPELARNLLHGERYHKAKAKIMWPLEKFFQAMEKRVQENLSLYREKKKWPHLILPFTMGLALLLLLTSVLLARSSVHANMSRNRWVLLISIILLVLLSIIACFQVMGSEKQIALAEKRRYHSYLLADELRQSSDDLTQMARLYALTGNARYQAHFQNILDIRNGLAARPDQYHHIYWDFVLATGKPPRPGGTPMALRALMEEAQFSEYEFSLLGESEERSNSLVSLEKRAMDAMEKSREGHPGNHLLASQLLHGEEYHRIKGRIMGPIAKFFQAIDLRTGEELAFYLDKRKKFALVLSITLGLSFLLLFLGILLLFFSSAGGWSGEPLSRTVSFSSLRANFYHHWSLISLALVAIFIIVGLSWWSLRDAEVLTKRQLKEELDNNLQVAHDRVLRWIEGVHAEALFFSELIVRRLPSHVLGQLQQNRFDMFNRELVKLGILNSNLFQEYMIVNAQGVIASSSHGDLVGTQIPFLSEALQSLKHFSHQEVYFADKRAPPLLAKKVLFSSLLPGDGGAVFFLHDPQKSLSALLRSSFLGQSGEVYLVNSDGQFMSEGRWKEKMLEQKQWDTELWSYIGFPAGREQGPSGMVFPLSVEEITKGRNSRDLMKYANYLSEDVLGLWLWDHTYQLGVITEMNAGEALAVFQSHRSQLLLGCSFTVLLILILVMFALWKREELAHAYSMIKMQNEKFAEDLELGQKVQLDMLPDGIEGESFHITAILKPARVVSGDFYDFSLLDDKRIYFCLGDVSGKGVPAALFMSATRAFVRKTLGQTMSPGEIVSKVNHELSQNNDRCMFVTLILGIIDLSTGILSLTNAGHNPPYFKKKNGELVCLEKMQGPFVGPLEGTQFKTQAITMSVGDTLLLYTDGITEAQNIQEEFYGEKRLEDSLQSQAFPSLEAMTGALIKDVTSFAGEAVQSDDITILALQYLGESQS